MYTFHMWFESVIAGFASLVPILTRTYSEEGVPPIDSILRQHGQETFINRMLSVDVPVSSLAKKHLFFFKDEISTYNPFFAQCLRDFLECMESKNSDLEKLLKATRQLHDLIDQGCDRIDASSICVPRMLWSYPSHRCFGNSTENCSRGSQGI
ncbi:hypothetical protein POM88_020774 [Heracleum sosnowskyi]|uniref:Uncharacterized protein n=1 Tax=Heracleum sosnowskyi TaxID=360622 RepID=A0AAD8IDH1_9APIA|nr:hypothetical protein POM88_020774 [Heracleum sosnowskyi]